MRLVMNYEASIKLVQEQADDVEAEYENLADKIKYVDLVYEQSKTLIKSNSEVAALLKSVLKS